MEEIDSGVMLGMGVVREETGMKDPGQDKEVQGRRSSVCDSPCAITGFQ